MKLHFETNNNHIIFLPSSFWGILFVGVRILIEAEPVVDYTGEEGYR